MLEFFFENPFAICQIGKWESFSPMHIRGYSKHVIDISKPFTEWMNILKDVHNLFIVSRFDSEDDIAYALEFTKICRNNLIFIQVITPITNKHRDGLCELQNEVDVCLYVEEDNYFRAEIVDPVSYAIGVLGLLFENDIAEFVEEPYYDGPLYAFSKSGSAQILTFELSKTDLEQNSIVLPDEVVGTIQGKGMAALYIESGFNISYHTSEKLAIALKKLGGMIFSCTAAIERNNKDKNISQIAQVTALISDLSNPNNSFGNGNNKTRFQRRFFD